ncbi:SAM-dependent methyltransferase [Oceanicella sp. SM1341]|uniref:SAM-dependent methyltransferase n=1 Tax=Oceanicella sp. SM1341 TaxID=1548889 RepID=UPI000E4ED4FE|nr:SAM-dependent methyltransferase [Oceanicella sp. SM1341]
MSGVALPALEALYAQTDDPWNFRHSAYEQAKFARTRQALAFRRWGAVLEAGCGNGALARHLAPLCRHYTGIDAVPRALEAARSAVPGARFERCLLPDELPDDPPGGPFELIILSEVLYFLDAGGIARLAAQVSARWPEAWVLAVNWCGESGNALQGPQAQALFEAHLPGGWACLHIEPDYRIDIRRPGRGGA